MVPKMKLLGLALLCCASVARSRLVSQKTGFESWLHYNQLYDPEQLTVLNHVEPQFCRL